MQYIVNPREDQDLFGLFTCSLQECSNNLANSDIISVDTETTGLDFLSDTLLMLQIYDGKDSYVIECRGLDLSPLKAVLESKNIVKLFHNAKFDYKFLRSAGIRCERVQDTMLQSKVIHTGLRNVRHSLKDVAKRRLDKEYEKTTRSTFINHKGPFTKEQVVYGIQDVEDLIEINRLQWEEIDKLDLAKAAKLENNVVLAFADIEFNGIYLDKTAWERIAKDVKKDVDALFEEMENMLYDEFPEYREMQTDLFGGGRANTLNWNSPKEVLAFMKKFDSSLDGVGGPVLKPIANKHPIIAKYVEYKEKTKLYNAYGPDFYKYIKADGKIHTNFDQILETGRVSSRGPNMQQIPADNTYRNAFIPKEDDWVFVSSDFSAQELCIIAFGSQDPVWLKVLREGGDLHGTCAELVFGQEWTKLGANNDERKNTPEGKKLRTHIKVVNFGLAYGMAAFSLAGSLGISEKEAKALIAKYYKTFPKIKGFLEKLGKYGKKHGNIRTYNPFRRMRRFMYWDGDNTSKSDMAKIERASKNTPIQGSGADMTKLALVMLREVFKDEPRVRIVMTVHDQIDMVVHEGYAEKASEILSGTMEKAAEFIVGQGLLKSDSQISKQWEK